MYPQLLNDTYIVVIARDIGLITDYRLIQRLWIDPKIVDDPHIVD